MWRQQDVLSAVLHFVVCAQALMRRSQALQQLDDLERALADAQRVRNNASSGLCGPAPEL